MGAAYDNQLALRLAAACQLAYNQFENTLVPPPGYQVSAQVTATLYGQPELIGFLMSSASDNVFALRGTDSFLDWLADATYAQTPFGYVDNSGLVHEGFRNVYQSMRDQVLPALQAAPANLPLYITGHSLGGGLSTLAALDIAANSPFANPVVYTIASPGVGDPDFAARYSALVNTSWRVLNVLDVVLLLPPEDIFDGVKLLHYKHVAEWKPIMFLKGGVAENHALGNYVEKMKKL
jgi:triacylglycerol lipase